MHDDIRVLQARGSLRAECEREFHVSDMTRQARV